MATNTDIDVPQRIEELEMALANAVVAVKRPTVSSIDEGDRRFLQVSWVTASRADTSLDSRCALTVSFTREQLSAYTRMPPHARESFRERLASASLAYFNEQHSKQEPPDNCSAEYVVPDTLLIH